MRAFLLAFLTCTLSPLHAPTVEGCPSGVCAPSSETQVAAWCPSGSCDDTVVASVWCPSGSCDVTPPPVKGQKVAASCPYGSCDVVAPSPRT